MIEDPQIKALKDLVEAQEEMIEILRRQYAELRQLADTEYAKLRQLMGTQREEMRQLTDTQRVEMRDRYDQVIEGERNVNTALRQRIIELEKVSGHIN